MPEQHPRPLRQSPVEPHEPPADDPWTDLGDAVRTVGLAIGATIADALRWLADGLDVIDR
jgi:hypothetical protein